GVVVRKDIAEKYPEIVVAFIKAVYDAGKWIDEDPMRATDLMEKWTGVEKEVLYLYFSRGGHLTQDPTIKQQWIDTLVTNAGRPLEIWHARDGIIQFPSLKAFLKGVAEFHATGAKLNATYVY